MDNLDHIKVNTIKNQDAERVVIPRTSFTAFRLLHQDSVDISHCGKSELIGGFPDIWLGKNGPNIISRTAFRIRNKMKKRLKQSINTLDNLRKNTELEDLNNKRIRLETDLHDLFKAVVNLENEDINRKSETSGGQANNGLLTERLQLNYHRVNEEESVVEDVQPYIPLKLPALNLKEKTSSIASTSGSSEQGEQLSANSSISSEYTDTRTSEDYDYMSNNGSDYSSVSGHGLGKFLNNNLSRKSSYKTALTSVSPPSTNLKNQVVKRRASSKYAGNTFLQPEVVDSIDASEELSSKRKSLISKMVTIVEPDAFKHKNKREIDSITSSDHIRRRIGRFAGSTGTYLKQAKYSQMSTKLYFNLWRNYTGGEIMRMDTMLVLVKHIPQVNVAVLTENETFPSRVVDYWKEYYVVLREGNNSVFILQLYDTFLLGNGAKKAPDYEIALNETVHASYYSYVDKSLSITKPNSRGTMVYILRTRGSNSSLRWLFYLKFLLKEELKRPFNVIIPDLGFSIKLAVLESSIVQNLEEHRNQLIVYEGPYGYKIQHSFLFQHILTEVRSKLKNMNFDPSIKKWLENTQNCALSFRNYDRLDWIEDSSEAIYMSNTLLTPVYHLELRRRAEREKVVSEREGKVLKEPIPVEGFLSRLTNIDGHETSNLRSFHKISYFHTCDHLLFYNKFFKALPPSPDNELFKDEADIEKLRSMPIIFLNDPYPIDECGHITWLKDKNFKEFDNWAISDYIRKTQQVARAEAVIDITNITEIRAVHHSRNRNTQNLLLCMVWYSSSKLINDENILDAVFEIKMRNGGILRLQASCRAARDIWVERLEALRLFWIAKKKRDLEQQIETRNRNMEALKTNEYIDSNIISEETTYGTYTTFAHPNLNNFNSLSIARAVLTSGYLYMKQRIHSSFEEYFVVLCPGYILLYFKYDRSRITGKRKSSSSYRHYMSIPIRTSYIYSGNISNLDILEGNKELNMTNPTHHPLPRIYQDGWKSSEEDVNRCFSIWIGKKRKISGKTGRGEIVSKFENQEISTNRNPGIIKMSRKFGITGKTIVFMARSRQERQHWVKSILSELGRLEKY